MNQQSYFDGLHYNKANYEVNSEDILADDVIETTSRQFLKNTGQTIQGEKNFTDNIGLLGGDLSFDNLTISSNGNHTWSNNGLDKVLSATNSSGASSSLTFESGGNTTLMGETGKIISLKVGGTTKIQCTSSLFKLFTCQLDIPFGTTSGGIKINGNSGAPVHTYLHTISGTDVFNINSPMTQITGALSFAGFVTVTGTYTLNNTSTVFLADTSSASCSFRLPSATNQSGRYFTLIRKDSGTVNQLTINVGINSQIINGSTSNISSTVPYEAFKIFCDGTQWYTL